jgi:hypothetical protein
VVVVVVVVVLVVVVVVVVVVIVVPMFALPLQRTALLLLAGRSTAGVEDCAEVCRPRTLLEADATAQAVVVPHHGGDVPTGASPRTLGNTLQWHCM